jgi:hypothetical protein
MSWLGLMGRRAAATLVGSAAVLLQVPLSAQILIRDDFDDTSGPLAAQGDGLVDVAQYRAPFGGADFTGRTQFRFELPRENVSQTGVGGVGSATGSTDGKVAVLELSTYNPLDPGGAFYGTDLISKRNFLVGGGLRMETRMRVADGTPGGLVGAAFLYDVTRENPPGTLVRDEIDHELLTNLTQGAEPHQTFTNVWDDGDFSSAGSGAVISNQGAFNAADFHTYRTDWLANKVQYYIDDVLVRTEVATVPDDPMRAHMNFWAPDSSFAMAYNGGLNPVDSPAASATYELEIDYLQVERFNTQVSDNLLVDGSFEVYPLDFPNADGTGGWTLFNNAAQGGLEVPAQDGFESLKVYGPFTGSPNASGAWQNVKAAPGEQFQGSLWAYAPSGDPILGNANYATVTLQFVNAAGAVIGSVNYSPGTNQQETAMLDGRDVNLIQDEWVQYAVDAVAPAGTAFARINAFFIQMNNEGGSIWFDNASLNRLTPVTTFALADLDLDGAVDEADLALWAAAFGEGPGADLTGDLRTGGADFLAWQRASSPAAAASVTGVPEPNAAWLAASAIAAAAGRRRRRG